MANQKIPDANVFWLLGSMPLSIVVVIIALHDMHSFLKMNLFFLALCIRFNSYFFSFHNALYSHAKIITDGRVCCAFRIVGGHEPCAFQGVIGKLQFRFYRWFCHGLVRYHLRYIIFNSPLMIVSSRHISIICARPLLPCCVHLRTLWRTPARRWPARSG